MRKTTIAAFAVALAGVAAGCGNAEDTAEDTTPGSSQEAEGGDAEGSGEHGDAGELMTRMNEAMMAEGTVTLSYEGEAAGASISGEGVMEYQDGGAVDSSTSMDVPDSPSPVRSVQVGQIMYLNLGQEFEPGKSWLKIDPNEEAAGAGAMFQMLGQQAAASGNPMAMLQEAEDALSIVDSAEEEVNGQQATRYTVSLDVARAGELVQDEMQAQAMQMLAQQGVDTIEQQIWLNDADLPVQVVLDQEIPGAEDQATTTIVTYSGWGEPVDITVPAEEETVSANDLEVPSGAPTG
ncbi:hypothetical protein C1701_14820 [Actinoalloteichus sp. AHMU CJ021]|uniref:Lipoprotein n=1 Tax=Actinoalloteichus caeruleus DSM 43889 TaxID=1120930 RepID=A0ABT1JMJ3_ACTCY|nr:hypothetical protein [Actinoalloteichus caeruleus]AUS79423.1 hypothetical protein C1701_14820 [Actinoalloteichus sp. AHMU CJ021]MCP2333732.1 hypothetical protein [Actinoalloteichus caeruleus DSM 43889]